MGKIHGISDSEKELLHAVGRHPDMSLKELTTHTRYNWARTVDRKLKQLKEHSILLEPYYDLNYEKLCKNPLHKLFCILESRQSYETVMSYLEVIEPLKWVYPVLSPHKELLNVGFYSSNDAAMADLFQVLKENDIITDYIVRAFRCKRMAENPNFFGDFNPSLDGLLNPCKLPDMSLGQHDTVWNECDMRILPYLRIGYKGGKLIEILKEEKKLHRTWTYDQVRYSREKMIKNGLIEKKYVINPFPLDQRASFNLFLKTEDIALTQRILYNFARGERVYREYVLCEEWGMITCSSHPRFLTDLMNKLDRIDEIKERELYQLRSEPPGRYYSIHPLELKYYDFGNQTLEYPYHVYKEKIKEKIESELIIQK